MSQERNHRKNKASTAVHAILTVAEPEESKAPANSNAFSKRRPAIRMYSPLGVLRTIFTTIAMMSIGLKIIKIQSTTVSMTANAGCHDVSGGYPVCSV